MTQHTLFGSPRSFLARGSRLPASLMVAMLLGTTACPGDDAPVTTGEDSTTGDDSTTTMTPVTVTITETTTETPDTETVGVDSTDGMTAGPACGDDVAEGDEQCDGTDLAGQDCASQGFDGGDLTCAADCTFDTSGCTNTPVCGNDVIDGKDVCDGTDLGGEDCASQGFAKGTLACLDDCTGYDTAECGSATCEDEDIGMTIGDAVSMGDTTMSDDTFEPSCGGMSGPDHAVLFTAPADGVWAFDTFGSMYDTKIALYTDCDNASEVACNDDSGRGLQSRIAIYMTAGQAIFVVIDGFDGETGSYVLNILQTPCGDGVLDPGEICDGAAGPVATCDDTGFGGAGPVTCALDCTGLDASTCNAPTGFGNCASFTASTVCTAEEICAGDGAGGAVCLEADNCADASDCGPAPATGTAPVTCADIAGEGLNDCYLSCEMGETCPDGMVCTFNAICLWAPLP